MKKIFFSIMAMALLSASAFAGGGKPVARKHKAIATKVCPPNCPRSQDCSKGAACTHMPECAHSSGCSHS